MIQCLKLLFYKDSRASDVIQLAVVDKNGIRIEKPFKMKTDWEYKEFVDPQSDKHRNE